jgi:hypothetical protein
VIKEKCDSAVQMFVVGMLQNFGGAGSFLPSIKCSVGPNVRLLIGERIGRSAKLAKCGINAQQHSRVSCTKHILKYIPKCIPLFHQYYSGCHGLIIAESYYFYRQCYWSKLGYKC